MKNLFIFFLLIFNFSVFSQNHEKELIGTWKGKLKIENEKSLNIIFHFSLDKNKKLMASMDSPDQGAYQLEMENVRLVLKYIKAEIPAFKISFKGKIVSKDSIAGEFSQGNLNSILNLKKSSSEVKRFVRPQEPVPPFPYKKEEVVFNNNQSNISLSGTLTYPKGKGKFPVVVLISGSGPQDRNEEIMGHKPFWVIADYLTKNGIAVFRYDDRGVGESKGDYSTATTADFALDALSAIQFLRNHPKINHHKIGLIGHSEGGMVAQMLAASDKNIAHIILMASPGIPIKELMIQQTESTLRMSGIKKEEIDVSIELNKKFYSLIISNDDDEKCRGEIEKIINDHSNSMPTSESNELKKKTPYIIKSLLSPWFRYFIRFNPEFYLKDIKCPVLALNGEKDVQVHYKNNLNSIQSILKNNGNNQVSIKSFPSLNHLFQNSTTGAVSEYPLIEETISPEILEEIKNWSMIH
ncbi:MAG: alpha/beta fold hydrolase [Flavobacteriia bacterium]|nr:alpha/beta fold hydrolase [Flavobacteriia bacterium]